METNYYDYKIEFDKDNANCIMIYKDSKLHNMITCPPIEEGCDIITFDDGLKTNSKYIYNFKGLILITNKKERKLYSKGKLIAETKRKS